MSTINNPYIDRFEANKTKVMENESVTLEWEVKNAKTVSLDGVMNVQPSGSYVVSINQDRDFLLTASNRRVDVHEMLSVKLLEPVVEYFESDTDTVTENQQTAIRFSVKFAHRWKIVARYDDRKCTLAEGDIQDGYTTFDKSITVLLEGSCELEFTAANGVCESVPMLLRMYINKPAVSIDTDKSVAAAGSVIRVTWTKKHCGKLLLSPGQIDVTELPYYDMVHSGEPQMSVELTGYGDFGQKVTAAKRVFIAAIDYFKIKNNGDPDNPEFFLQWSTSGLENTKLLPENISVREMETKYLLREADVQESYTLIGYTPWAEPVSKEITPQKAAITRFALQTTAVVVGSTASFTWTAVNAKRLQLQFSGGEEMIPLPLTENSYHFQVLASMYKAKLIAWGDSNICSVEIPIQRFTGPEIKQLDMQAFSLQLGIKWAAAPVYIPQGQTSRLLAAITGNGGKTVAPGWRFLYYLSYPSTWLLRLAGKLSSRRIASAKSYHLLSKITNKDRNV